MATAAKRKLILLRLGIQFSIAMVLSLVMTTFNYGINDAFVSHWAKGLALSSVTIDDSDCYPQQFLH